MDLLSEEEQWERLKNWVRTNGPQVFIILALLLIGWFGWKWWQARGDQKAIAAGAAYEKVLLTFDANKPDEALALIEELRRQHPKSAYVPAADLIAARVFVATNELDKAVERLQRVADTAPDKKLRPVAKLRLARVQSSQGKYDAALATLGTESLGLHEAARLEARGDVLLAKGERDAALKEYEAARLALLAGGEADVLELVELKIADLRDGAAVAAETTAP